MSAQTLLLDRHQVTASDLIAFCDAQRVTVGPPIRPDGSGWIIAFDADAHVVTAWDKSGVKLERRCATLTEALEVIRRYEHGLPL
jgi:ferric-dicitrate binding protein FerR (iron transport regulator)